MEPKFDQYKIAELIFLELKGELSETERAFLESWKKENPENLILHNRIIDENNIIRKVNAYNRIDKQKAWNRLGKILINKQKTNGIPLRNILKYASAASIIIIIGCYFLFRKSSPNMDEKLAYNTENTVVLSGTQKATLTTSNNEIIELGRSEERRTIQLGSASATDTNNTLIFQNEVVDQPEKITESIMNTLSTPRGGEYTIILSDGTKVFLNAETKLTFPEVFTQNAREVLMEGEAYFEVTKSETMPFIVKTSEYEIKVYGTSFNVSAYTSDTYSQTTLVEGSVGINTATGSEVKLIPGEQVNFNKKDHNLSKRKVDTRAYTAWKDGMFIFDNETLDEIMRKLERWYNIETVYISEDLKNRHFSGTLDRYNDISEILDMIALTTNIDFHINKNIIVVDKK